MPFYLIQNDITKMEVDAIVNAANRELLMGGGVCGAIYKAAGATKMAKACSTLGPINTGQAVITPGFDLATKHVIHTVGPIYSHYPPATSEKLLYAAYNSALTLCAQKGLESVAFPLISSGIYGYPKDEAFKVAKNAILDFLNDHDLDVYLVLLGKSIISTNQNWLDKVRNYVDRHLYGDKHQIRIPRLASKPKESKPLYHGLITAQPCWGIDDLKKEKIDDALNNLDEPFSSYLFRLIDSKGKTDVEVYKRANIDRKLFSKIRTIPNYIPNKRTTIALAIALELNIDETESLLKTAGYALSHSQVFDVIIEYFIINRHFDIYDINEVLFSYDQALLGS